MEEEGNTCRGVEQKETKEVDEGREGGQERNSGERKRTKVREEGGICGKRAEEESG